MADEIHSEDGTATGEGKVVTDPNPAPGATATGDGTEPFADPTAIPPELQPHFKRMQASYTRKMQALSSEKAAQAEKLSSYERLMNDPEFARQVIVEAAPRLGLSVAPAGNGRTPADAGPPPQLVERIAQSLAPEMQWMAPAMANAQWEANRMLLEPLINERKQEAKSTNDKEFEALADSLSQRVPDWAEHEDDMSELLDFLQSEKLTHPSFGSKLDILYNVVTKNTAATQEAIRRMSAAGRARTVTGRAESTTQPNITERVQKAKTMQDAFRIAAEDAQRAVGGTK